MKTALRYLTVAAGLALMAQSAFAQTKYYPNEDRDGACFQEKPSKLAITQGSEKCNSSTYYRRIGAFLNIDFQMLSLNELAGHMGYDVNFAKRDLETMIPVATLNGTPSSMTPAQSYWVDRQNEVSPDQRVLVSRFFAPKIVNYSTTSGPYTPGWRKLVYLPIRPGSAAKRKGRITGAYILFNYFAKDRTSDPYSAKDGDGHAISGNNQVILVPADLSPQVAGQYRDSAFFAVYSGFVPGDENNSYRLLNTLTAGFDIPADKDLTDYAIPDACAQCHGHDKEFGQAVDELGNISTNPYEGVFPFVKPNYLDTDQWYDAQRLDYPDLIGVLEPVFDGGTNRFSGQYQRAMNVIYQLNALMKTQGAVAKRPSVGGKEVDAFQQDAVEKWLALHEPSQSRTTVYAPDKRLFSSVGTLIDADRGEMQLATDHLSQFCFRCHSSIKFNVFDYDYIRSKGATLSAYVPTMPLGRVLRGTQQACLKATLNYLGSSNTTNSRKVVDNCGSSQLMKGVSVGTNGTCYVVSEGRLQPGSKVMQASCAGDVYAESVWRHDTATGLIHSTKRPDLCLGVAPVYINRKDRKISPTPIQGGVLQYSFEPITLQRCGQAANDVLMRWDARAQDKMHVFHARRDTSLCLSGDDVPYPGVTSQARVESCSGGYRNGAYFILTFEATKDKALASIK